MTLLAGILAWGSVGALVMVPFVPGQTQLGPLRFLLAAALLLYGATGAGSAVGLWRLRPWTRGWLQGWRLATIVVMTTPTLVVLLVDQAAGRRRTPLWMLPLVFAVAVVVTTAIVRFADKRLPTTA
jgi:hypothetical protein